MASNIAFYDDDGQPIGIGETVCIQFIVDGASRVKPDDPYLTVRLHLKHSPCGMKYKIDSSQEIHTVPSCIVARE